MFNESHLYLHSKSEKCVFNEHGQCIKGFRYFCAYCNYGLGGIYSSCYNPNCCNSDDNMYEKVYDDNDIDNNVCHINDVYHINAGSNEKINNKK